MQTYAFISSTDDVEKRQVRRLGTRKLGTRRRTQQGSNPQVIDPTPAGKRVVCYYSNWSVYRKGIAKFVPQHINPYLCTHLVYAFAGLNDEMEMTAFDSYQDIDKGRVMVYSYRVIDRGRVMVYLYQDIDRGTVMVYFYQDIDKGTTPHNHLVTTSAGGYSQFAALKQYNKDLRNLLAVGGWEEGSSRFSELVASPELRKVFTESAIRHLRRYNFDGLDLDWEYPASRAGSAPSDKEHYVLLVQELKEAFEEEAAKSNRARLLLTMAVPAGQVTIDKGFDVAALNMYLDFFNILNYDYYSVLSPSVYNHAALLPVPGTSEYEDAYKLNVVSNCTDFQVVFGLKLL
ncbi:Glycoside hydrolase family 18 catalytic domain [Trinorchestia longiramus]|nr:Glycoside hydrolase family 18 catalytic domain [Trinorchestia longiramus]